MEVVTKKKLLSILPEKPKLSMDQDVLVLLLSCPGKFFSLDEIIMRLWRGNEEPESAEHAIRAYVYKLRKQGWNICTGIDAYCIRKRGPGLNWDMKFKKNTHAKKERNYVNQALVHDAR